MADASSKRTKVLACGSNLFGQIHAESKNRSATPLCLVPDAAGIVAVCNCQTIIRSHSGSIQVLGEGASLVEHVCRTIWNDGPLRLDQLVFVGQDMFEAILDVEGRRCYFLHYDTEDGVGSSSVVENSRWKAAAADGRGRCMAIDAEGQTCLFDSMVMFMAGTGQTESAAQLRYTRRFMAQSHTAKDSKGSATPPLPKFQKVSAGNAHFVLLAQTGGQEGSVWIFGDARFGAIPMLPFEHTTVVGVLSPSTGSNSTTSTAPTDVSYLLPVPHFSTDQGFPSHIADVVAGARHTLVLTTDGDLYGWGWNEDACLLPFADSETPEWDENVVYEPTLVSLPPSPEDEHDTVALSRLACSNGRSFGITTGGQLVVAGSNEFECLALDPQLESVRKKPRFERDFSQIKKPYDCVNGCQLHPTLRSVLDIHVSSLATFITVDLAKALD